MSIFITYLKKISVLFLVVAFISGCASGSKSIEAAYVSPLQYQSYDCNQIGQEMSRVGRKVSEVSGQQDNVAGKDAAMMGVGLVIFWPALFFLAAGEDRKEELARLKGEADALEQSAINKQCTEVIAQVEAERKLLEEKHVVEMSELKTGDVALVELRNGNQHEMNIVHVGKNSFNATYKQSAGGVVTPQIFGKDEVSKIVLLKRAKQSQTEQLAKPLPQVADPKISKKAEAASSTTKQTVLSLNNEPQDNAVHPSTTVKPQTETIEAQVYKTKCTHCGDVIAYKEKYSGSLFKCMQCDKEFELP